MSNESVITISIKEVAQSDQQSFLFNILLDGEVIAANQSLSVADSSAVRELSKQFNAMFETHNIPENFSDNLKVIGAQLFQLWLAKSWPDISSRVKSGSQRTLVIASESSAILNLPWELICPDGKNCFGLDAKFAVRRLPWLDRPLAEFAGTLPPRPLRVLFMACAPIDEVALDFEREEEALIRAIAGAGQNVTFDSEDSGTFEGLIDRINEFQPHIVHLTGHGIVDDDGLGYFAFEDERGRTDMRSSVDMREQLFSGSSVQLAFISGCQTGKAPPIEAIGGVCQGIVSEEVPMAIGWAASIADYIAIDLAITFYKRLAAGLPVDKALTQARRSVQRECDEQGYPAWTLPVLYSASTQSMVFDTDPKREPVPPLRSAAVQRPLEGMTEGYAEHFVGRRREIQRLLPAMRDGEIQTLILTGLGGAGKSTLATRLARKLEPYGFTPIAVPSTRETPLSVSRLIQACGVAFVDAGLRNEYDMLHDAGITVDDRLRLIVSTLNKHRFQLVLDNFEVNLDETNRQIIDKEIAGFYSHLMSSLVGESRAIITCRYLPAGTKLWQKAREEALGDFPESAFMKFMMREREVENRYYNGDLPQELLKDLHRLLGGTPRFLAQIREVLKTIEADDLQDALEKINLPAGTEASVLQKKRDEYCETIFTARLYGYLNEKSKQALSRIAVYGVAVSVEGLAAVAEVAVDEMRGFAREWQNYALAYPESERGAGDLWSVYGLLRGWLLGRLSEDERRAAHQAAGDFLRDMENQEREGELGLSWIECLIEARSQYIEAGDYAQAREATNRISNSLVMQGLYEELARINVEMLDYEAHPRPMIWIGRSHSERADYVMARNWYEQGLKAAGDVILEESARAWGGLAAIDLNEGNYKAARENFDKVLNIGQQIDDRLYQASAWHNLAVMDMNEGNYEAARKRFNRALEVFQQIGNKACEAATWHGLATIELHEGNYMEAREKLQESMKIEHIIGDPAVEAATWHQLATIDLREGDYKTARENSDKALKISQQIGDRVGEAATFYQLGVMADKSGRLSEATRLVALSFLIDQSIGHSNTQIAQRMLSQMAAELNYTQEQFDSMLQEVIEAYNADRGASLIKAAFPEG